MTGAMAPIKPLNATDLCDRCRATAYVRVILPGSGELLFCAHHNRQHADALAKMLTWHDVDELFTLAHFVGCTRPGHRLSGAGLPDGKVSLVEIPALAISSTECRVRVEAGEPVWYLVPDGVVQYIVKRGLYAKASDSPSERVGPDPSST